MRGLLAIVLLSATHVASGQTAPAPSEPVKWDVTSVKPMSEETCKTAGGGVRYLANGLSAFCVPIVFTVEFAYHLMDPARIVGLPKWAAGPQLYAIDARVAAQDADAFNKLKREEKAEAMQSVLAERFGMKTHREKRELPALALVVAKNGSKLKTPKDTENSRSQFGGTTGEVNWMNAPLQDLLFLLAKETGRPVVDSTGLTGRYDFTLLYAPAADASNDNSTRPTIFTALEEQLGLKLVPTKALVEVLVVDSLQRPSEN